MRGARPSDRRVQTRSGGEMKHLLTITLRIMNPAVKWLIALSVVAAFQDQGWAQVCDIGEM